MGDVVWTHVAPSQFEVITPFMEAEDGQHTDTDNFAIQITSEKRDGVVVEGQPDDLVEFLNLMITSVLESRRKYRANKAGGHRE